MDEFLRAQHDTSGPGVAGWWETLDISDEQRASLDAAGMNAAISHRAIATVLERWGYPITVGQVGHWRRNVIRWRG